jgi:multidrug transporter EmrE-like cation transporter
MSLAEIFGNVNFKMFAESNSGRHLIGGVFGYIAVMYFLVQSFMSANMLWVGAMWEGMITVIGSLVAYFVLGERFTSPVQYVGLALGLLAMLMVHYGGNHP